MSRDCSVTVVICTFNRAAYLDDALRSLAALQVPAEIRCEVLVVDNNSTDGTRAVVDRWAGRCSLPLRYAFEPAQGLSTARNRAVSDAAGDWLWYVDDDVYFSPGWWQGVLAGLRAFPDAAALGGAVVATFEPVEPSGLPVAALGFYGATSLGDTLRRLAPTEYPVGANMALRRSVFDAVGLFREDLGRVADALRCAEETELIGRLHARGLAVGYAPGAAVRHRVPARRATLGWLRRRAFWGGISHVAATHPTACATRGALVRAAAASLREVGRAALRDGLDPNHQLHCAWHLGMARQYLAEAARRTRPGRAAPISDVHYGCPPSCP